MCAGDSCRGRRERLQGVDRRSVYRAGCRRLEWRELYLEQRWGPCKPGVALFAASPCGEQAVPVRKGLQALQPALAVRRSGPKARQQSQWLPLRERHSLPRAPQLEQMLRREAPRVQKQPEQQELRRSLQEPPERLGQSAPGQRLLSLPAWPWLLDARRCAAVRRQPVA